jgi:hypothetical protein
MHGEVGFDHFEGEAYRDPQVRAQLPRIRTRVHAHQPRGHGMEEHFECDLTITTRAGSRYSAHVDQPLRGPRNLVPPDRLEAKFRDCAARALRAGSIEEVLRALQRTDTYADVRAITGLLAAAVKPEAGGGGAG